MAFYQFQSKQKLKATVEELWDFISSPKNLKEITPDYMGFEITSENLPEKMHKGMIISYKVSPMFNFKMTWVTEITQVEDKVFFVDEQRMGPYKMWHHQHRLIPQKDGTVLMHDIISYQPPFGFLGIIANTLFIKSKLKEIFSFRERVLEERFNKRKNKDIMKSDQSKFISNGKH